MHIFLQIFYNTCKIVFSMIWMLEPAFLTVISVTLLVLALVDYLLPPLTSFLCSFNTWTGQKEKKLNEICQNLSATILYLQSLWRSILQTRNERPNVVRKSIICSGTH